MGTACSCRRGGVRGCAGVGRGGHPFMPKRYMKPEGYRAWHIAHSLLFVSFHLRISTDGDTGDLGKGVTLHEAPLASFEGAGASPAGIPAGPAPCMCSLSKTVFCSVRVGASVHVKSFLKGINTLWRDQARPAGQWREDVQCRLTAHHAAPVYRAPCTAHLVPCNVQRHSCMDHKSGSRLCS